MKAITTKYMGPTNTRGSRICAKAEGVGKVCVSSDYGLDSEGNHRRAAEALAKKHGWSTDLCAGGLPDGRGYAFVFKSGCKSGGLGGATRRKRRKG